MKTLCFVSRWGVAAAFAAVCAAALRADTVVTTNGARIVGKITLIDAGLVSVDTDFAGTIRIKQDKVAAIETDKPIAIRLASGTRMEGQVATTQTGSITVTGADGTLTTSVPKIAASWPAGDTDPAILALQRHWKYEVSVDIEGASGNHTQLGTDVGLKATLASSTDTLKLYTDYNRQEIDGAKSADQYKAGFDYSDTIHDGSTWYLRDEGGFDRVQDISFYDTAAFGYGYDVVKSNVDTLTLRTGLAYRYDGYTAAADTPAVNSAGLDLEIVHDLKFPTWELGNALDVVPAFSDFSNVLGTQDSFFQIPLANPAWKWRTGVSNNYLSKPPRGIQKLDTTYYSRLILDW